MILSKVKFPFISVKLAVNKRREGRKRNRIAKRKNGATPSQVFQLVGAAVLLLRLTVVCAIAFILKTSLVVVRPRFNSRVSPSYIKLID